TQPRWTPKSYAGDLRRLYPLWGFPFGHTDVFRLSIQGGHSCAHPERKWNVGYGHRIRRSAYNISYGGIHLPAYLVCVRHRRFTIRTVTMDERSGSSVCHAFPHDRAGIGVVVVDCVAESIFVFRVVHDGQRRCAYYPAIGPCGTSRIGIRRRILPEEVGAAATLSRVYDHVLSRCTFHPRSNASSRPSGISVRLGRPKIYRWLSTWNCLCAGD